MKYLQEEYWGSKEWKLAYALRSAVEAVFGNIRILEQHGRESGEQFNGPLLNRSVEGELIERLALRGDEVFEHL